MKFLASEKLNFRENLTFNPGPGHYDTRGGVITQKFHSAKSKSAVNVPFGQARDRFQPTTNSEEAYLGPGYYFGQKEWQAKKSQKDPRAQFYPNPRKIITIPSIPSSTHAMGYVEREDGYLIPLNGSAVKDDKDLGPGAYVVSEQMVTKKVKGFSLAKTTSPRFPAEKIANAAPEVQMEINDAPRKEYTIKEEYHRKKEVPKTVQAEAVLPNKNDDAPGLDPGYYYNERNASSFNVQNKPPQFQHFGTTAKRFSSGENAAPLPGPGNYHVLTPIGSKGPYQGMRVESFARGEVRFKDGLAPEMPGPGAYEMNSKFGNNEIPIANLTPNIVTGFGSSLSRFGVQKPTEDLPGPGAYNPDKNKRKKYRKRVRRTAPVQDRFSGGIAIEEPREPVLKPDFGLGGRSKGAVIVKHEMPANSGSSVFQSNIQRFADQKSAVANVLGPGTYDTDMKPLLKPTFNTANTTFDYTSRDDEKRSDQYKKFLGPGSYSYKVDPIKQKVNFVPKINPVSPFEGVHLAK